MPRLVYTKVHDWPPLAWLCRCEPGTDVVMVFHGPHVVTETDWFHEAVWDGEYTEGGFDQTDIVFGSGARVREDAVIFVSTGSTVDRLQSLATDECTWVSNSLACLFAATEATLEPWRKQYTRDVRSVADGLDVYTREIETSAGTVRFTFFHNLRWENGILRDEEKPNPARDFSTFERYRSFLETSLGNLAANMASNARQERYSWLGTLSTGYDSVAVTALARSAGLSEVLCVSERPEGEDDIEAQESSERQRKIARILGVRMIERSRDLWRDDPLGEVPFLVGDARAADLWLRGCASILPQRVLLTGNNGDGVWSKRPRDLGTNLRRGQGLSGLSMTEYRLWTGFIHCPVPYIGARQIADIQLISVSDEMAAWDVVGDYSRPIPRRIAEEAGVPRDAFATSKHGASIRLIKRVTLQSSPSAKDYLAWLRGKSRVFLAARQLPPVVIRKLAQPVQWVIGIIDRTLHAFGFLLEPSSLSKRLDTLSSRDPAQRYMFPWALERAALRYRSRHFEPSGQHAAGLEPSDSLRSKITSS